MPLQSAADHYAAQRRLLIVALAAARRAWQIGNRGSLARTLATLMDASASNGWSSVADMVDEQGLDAPPEALWRPGSLSRTASDGRDLLKLIKVTTTRTDLDRVARTQVADAGRTGQSIGMAVRPALTGYVRYLNPPSCARCAVLAGRFYRWSTGFLRHENCDCVMQPTTERMADGLIASPDEAFEKGQIRGLSKADTQAIEDGADIGKVVNVRRKAAGMSIGGQVFDRAGTPTPAAIYHLASDRADAIRLLRKFGYLI